MQIIRGSHNLDTPLVLPVLTLGNFDGVHVGHQAILADVVRAAKRRGGTGVVYTFDPHPAKVLAPDRPLRLLQTLSQRCAAIAACGIAVTVIEPFTRNFAQQDAATFCETLLRQRIRPVHIFIGHDFTFGSHRAGRTEHLKQFGARHGIAVDVIEPVFHHEVLISSSYLRQCVADGRMKAATAGMGRPYALEGTVVRGRGIGQQLGFPTLNMVPENELIPPEGVYVTTARWDDRAYPAATYIGRNPTFGGTTIVVETYCLDVHGAVTADRLALDVHERLRGDIRFDTPEALKEQIAKDVDGARKFHTKRV